MSIALNNRVEAIEKELLILGKLIYRLEKELKLMKEGTVKSTESQDAKRARK